MFWAISEEDDKDQTFSLTPRHISRCPTPPPTPVLRGQGTQDLGVSKVSEAGWIEMQPEVSLLGCSLWETEEPSLPLTASLRFF